MNWGSRREALILGLISLSGPLAVNMYVPAFPAMAKDLGASSATIQLSLVSFLAAMAIGQNIYGPLSDRLGRKPPLYGGLGLFILASTAASLSGTAEQLILWRFLQGLGASSAMAIARAIIRDRYTGSSAARMMSLVLLVISIGPLLAPIGGTGLVELFGWRSNFWFMALTGAISLTLLFLTLPESLPVTSRLSEFRMLRDYKALAGNRRFVSLALMSGLANAIYYAFMAGSPMVLMTIYGLKPLEFSLVFAFSAVSWMMSAQMAGRLMDHLGAKRLMSICVAASVAASCLNLALGLFHLGGAVSLIATMVFIFSALGILMPVSTVFALHPHGEAAGSASALMGTIGFIVSALASALVSVSETVTEIPMLVTMAGAAIASAAAAAVGLSSQFDETISTD